MIPRMRTRQQIADVACTNLKRPHFLSNGIRGQLSAAVLNHLGRAGRPRFRGSQSAKHSELFLIPEYRHSASNPGTKRKTPNGCQIGTDFEPLALFFSSSTLGSGKMKWEEPSPGR